MSISPKYLGGLVLTGSDQDIVTAGASETIRISSIIISNGSSAGTVTLKFYDSSGAVTRLLANAVTLAANTQIKLTEPIYLEPNDILKASAGTTVDAEISVYGLITPASLPPSTEGHTVQNEGTPLTQRANLNFVGSLVNATDDAGNDQTDVTIEYASTEITGKSTATPISGDFFLFSDTDDSGNLKKGDVVDLISNSFSTIVVSGQSDVVADSQTDTLTLVAGSNTTITTNAGSDSITFASKRVGVYREVWIPAGAMTPRTTNGAATGTVETSTNKITYDVFDFDQTTAEYVTFSYSFADQWDLGTIKAKIYWTAASGTGSVVWQIKAVSLADDDAIDTAYGTAQTVTDTLLATTDLHRTSATPAITIGNTPALGDLVFFEIGRLPSDGSDTLNADARLMGIAIQYLELQTEASAW